MTLIIHRGTNQIGGCITEIESNGYKVFIDFGEQLPENRKRKKRPDALVPDDYEPDDMYYVINEFGGHGHPSPCRVFPARLKIGKKLREELNKATNLVN